jgi:hypothetical protein
MWNKQMVLEKVNLGDEILVINDSDLSYTGILTDCEDVTLSLMQQNGDNCVTIFLDYEKIDSVGVYEKSIPKIKSEGKNVN